MFMWNVGLWWPFFTWRSTYCTKEKGDQVSYKMTNDLPNNVEYIKNLAIWWYSYDHLVSVILLKKIIKFNRISYNSSYNTVISYSQVLRTGNVTLQYFLLYIIVTMAIATYYKGWVITYIVQWIKQVC